MSQQNQPQTAQGPPKAEDPFKANIVTNIPMHTAGGPAAPAAQAAPQNSQDPDKIMRAVGDELKKEDINQPKHHFWNKKPDVNQQSKFSAHPVPRDAALPVPVAAPASPAPAAAQPHAAKPAASPAPPKPKSSVPVLAIIVTLIVTGGLIALAVASLS